MISNDDSLIICNNNCVNDENLKSQSKSDNNMTGQIKNKNYVLKLARNVCNHSQSYVLSNEKVANLYQIAFDDYSNVNIDDGDNNDIKNSNEQPNFSSEYFADKSFPANSLPPSCLTSHSPDPIASVSKSLPSNDSEKHIFVNHLSLADEILLAECSHSDLETEDINDFKNTNETVKQNQLNNDEPDVKDQLVVHQIETNGNSLRSDCSDFTNDSYRSYRYKPDPTSRLLVTRIIHETPIDSVTSFRDCFCCAIQ